jgi:antitoxin (DNA-binding transcriptional repressor) of toxin-antitoxin stability system
MKTCDVAHHPELAALVAAVRQGERVVMVDQGKPAGRCVALPVTLRERLDALHQSFTSPPDPGNSVVDLRRESR